MSASAAREYNQDHDFEAAVDALIERHGLDGAENRLLLALSVVRQRKAQSKRRGD